MSEFVEELRRIVWCAYHAKDYTPYYRWGSFEEVIPMYITHPLKHWYIWGLVSFGLLCAIYIPYFWIVYALLIGLLLLTTSSFGRMLIPTNFLAIITNVPLICKRNI